ncbi:ADP-forming succinate--CoA ligase subunit beta, partial [[Eubacterium] cellulosolvens]
MKIFEYEAKRIASQHGLPVPGGYLVSSSQEAREVAQKLGCPVVVKAQVLVAGRGKAAGIRIADTADDAEKAASAILGSKIKGEKVTKLLVEEKLDAARELYVGLVVDRSAKCYTLLASQVGGVDIEEVAQQTPEKIIKRSIEPAKGLEGFQARELAHVLGYKGSQLVELSAFIAKFSSMAAEYDSELAESNPLVETRKGNFVAADLRLIVDDNSLFRHKSLLEETRDVEHELSPLEVKAREKGLAYVDLDGDIGIVGNGAGLVMATLDMIQDHGGRPANFCDVGGGASAERIAAALEVVLSNPRVKVLFLNIMGGITRCDDVARGLLDVRNRMGLKKPTVIRLVGTNEEEGRKILQDAEIPSLETMEDAASKAVEAVKGA